MSGAPHTYAKTNANLVGCFLVLVAVCGGANAESPTIEDSQDTLSLSGAAPNLRKHVGLAYNQYREPSLDVRFEGPELVGGVQWLGVSAWALSSELMLGQQHYSSPSSGSRSGILNADWRAQGLYSFEGCSPGWRGVQSGLAVQVIYNDFAGQTSTGKSGYVRESRRLWWPVRWTQPLSRLGLEQAGALEVEVGVLLYGEQVSRLSQIGGTWQDATNRQRNGMYLQFKHVGSGQGLHLEPYLRATSIDTSDTVSAGAANTATEPRNLRLQLGLNWAW